MSKYDELAKKYRFRVKHEGLFDLAFTHSSSNINNLKNPHDYERLEFIGDSVLGFVSADLIYKLRPDMKEGDMTKLRSSLVRTASLASYARELNLASYIIFGPTLNNDLINKSDKILEDVFEALTGAIYLDNGMNAAYRFLRSFLKKDIKKAQSEDLTDSKSRLQEEMQSEHRDNVKYVVVKTYGPAHDRTFVVNVTFCDLVLGVGVGKTKKAAEEAAAKDALDKRTK